AWHGYAGLRPRFLGKSALLLSSSLRIRVWVPGWRIWAGLWGLWIWWLQLWLCASGTASLYPAGIRAGPACSAGIRLLALLQEAGGILPLCKNLPGGVAAGCPPAKP